MSQADFRVWWIHPESDSCGYDYIDALEGWRRGDMCQEFVALEQFTGLLDKNKKKIYECDIVKVLTSRIPEYGPEWKLRSKYDAVKIESRSVIVFDRFEWRLDTNTGYNRKILELKGSEKEPRRLSIREHLEDYNFFQESNPSSAWNREHNSHAYWSDIEVIGNIHENLSLIEQPEHLED